MPMFSEGGIFVPTTRDYKLGEDIYLLLSLPDDPQRYPVAGKVGWITPANASGGRTQGVGVRFPNDEKSKALRARIEEALGTTHLVGEAHADHLTAARCARFPSPAAAWQRQEAPNVFVDSHCHLGSPELAGAMARDPCGDAGGARRPGALHLHDARRVPARPCAGARR